MLQDSESVHISGGGAVHGAVRVAGAKNAATKMLVAGMLAQGSSTVIHDVPDIGDVSVTRQLLASVGVETRRWGRSVTVMQAGQTGSAVGRVGSMNRLPLLVAAALLHQHRAVSVPAPGGCQIGARPSDLWVTVLERMGCSVEGDEHGWRVLRVAGGLVGSRIVLGYPSVAATETALLTGVLARGRSMIWNAAKEPEVVSLGRMLIAMGARIAGLGTSRLVIDGVSRLHGVEWRVPGDRIEAASWAVLAAATDGAMVVDGCAPDALGPFLEAFETAGGGVERRGTHSMRFFRRKALTAARLRTGPWPALSTDYQQPLAVLLTQAEGASLVHETVYEQRLGFLHTLRGMGAEVELSSDCPPGQPCRFNGRYQHAAKIRGPMPLRAVDGIVNLPDLRGGMALVTAAAVATGTSRFTGWEQVARGYQNLAGRLQDLGVAISGASDPGRPGLSGAGGTSASVAPHSRGRLVSPHPRGAVT